MGVGVFGKLPARRDYVQNGVDRRLMDVLDPWLQTCLAESRRDLGEGWLDAWLCAPIWRFWLGSRIAGVPVLGAMMPSVDGVGRYFPLCVLGAHDGLPPPDEDEHAGWLDAAEGLMLAALAEGGTYEGLLAGLDALPWPPSGGAMGDGGATGTFGALHVGASGAIHDGASCWWTPPPDGVQPARALIRRGLPDPAEYAGLIAPAPRPTPQPGPAPVIGGA